MGTINIILVILVILLSTVIMCMGIAIFLNKEENLVRYFNKIKGKQIVGILIILFSILIIWAVCIENK